MLNVSAEASISLVAVLGFSILGAHNQLGLTAPQVAERFRAARCPSSPTPRTAARLDRGRRAVAGDTPEAVAAVEAARLEARSAADHVAQRARHADRLARLVAAEKAFGSRWQNLVALVTDAGCDRTLALRGAMRRLRDPASPSAARDSFNAAVSAAPTRGVRAVPDPPRRRDVRLWRNRRAEAQARRLAHRGSVSAKPRLLLLLRGRRRPALHAERAAGAETALDGLRPVVAPALTSWL